MDSTADEIFRIVPGASMPPGQDVVIVEIDGQPRWLIRDGVSLPDLVSELNQLSTHLVRHGLWVPQRGDTEPPRMRFAS